MARDQARSNGTRHAFGLRRGRSAAATLIRRMAHTDDSFWTVVHAPFMKRELTRRTVRNLVRLGLEQTRGNYRIVTRMFNMPPEDYKKFLHFLRAHDCHLPYMDYR